MRTLRPKRYWPEYGAIFMANKTTRKECFERKLFGLPCTFADFVMEVKTGMLLFLYDFEGKNLYGVFEAASDGAMDIIPHAYMSTSNMKFPAQVRFTTLWHCDPLPEHVFRDAIEENYYARSKFNFGLSKDQVSRLLCLFNNKMIKIHSSPMREEHEQKANQVGKSVFLSDSCSLEVSDLVKESIQELQDSILGKQELISEIQDSTQDSIPDNHDNLDSSVIQQSVDYIPLPSIEPDEIEDLSDVFQWSNMSFTEVGECLKNPVIWPLGNRTSLRAKDKKKVDVIPEFNVQKCDSQSSKGPTSCSDPKGINDSSRSEVQGGMYSDISMARTSAFLRLSGGLGKVVVEKSHRGCDSKVENLEDILDGLEMRRKKWDRKRSGNLSKSEVSVFSRLEKYKEGQERDEKVTYESMYFHKRSGSQSYKRKSYEYDHFSWYKESDKSTYYYENYKNVRYCSSYVLDFPDDVLHRQ